MAFFIFLLVVDVPATVVCVLKGRFFSAFFGVGAVVMASILLNAVAAPSTGDGLADLGRALGMGIYTVFVLFPLSLIVIIGALRQAKTWSSWATSKTWSSWATKQGIRQIAKVDKLVAKAGNHLEGDEQVLIAVDGTRFTSGARRSISTRAGVLIATDQRLLFYAKKGTESFPYESISFFEHDTTKNGDERLVFHSSGNVVIISWIHAKDLDEFVAAVKSKMDEA